MVLGLAAAMWVMGQAPTTDYVNSPQLLLSAGAAGGARVATDGFGGSVEAFVGPAYWHYLSGNSALTFSAHLHGLFSGMNRAGPGATAGIGYLPTIMMPALRLDLGVFSGVSSPVKIYPAAALNVGGEIMFFRFLAVLRDGYEVHMMLGFDLGEVFTFRLGH